MTPVIRKLCLLAGPLLFIILQSIGKPQSMPPSAFDVLCVTIWMATWWVSEVVPIAVTALLPIILFPLTGALDIGSTTAAYGHKYIFLYLGGFMVAIAIENWNLHKRIALTIISIIGNKIKFIILGFMLATGFLSMWISNTATSVMMLPIGMAIISVMKDNPESPQYEPEVFGKALLLAIAYSASIGGIGTLIGTPPNLVFAGILEELYGVEIGFMQWMLLGFPIALILLFICWKYLTDYAFRFEQAEFPGGKAEIEKLLNQLGKISVQEKRVLTVFIVTALLWITRSFLIQPFLPAIDDTIIAIAAGITLFIIPSKRGQRPLLTWEEAVKLPWGIILLFGGGMALAKGFGDTGLALWIGEQFSAFQNLPLFVLIILVVAAVNFLTEVTSNTATTAMLLPILAPMALTMGLHPYVLLISATLAASCAFMLPVATPPNAVVFGSGQLKISDMAWAGLWMNLMSVFLITVIVYFLLPFIWDFNIHDIPEVFKTRT